MEYSNLLLSALGVLGILMHNLVKMNELNRKPENNFRLGEYLRIEKFSIMLSLCVVGVALIAKNEVKQLDQVGNYLGLAFTAIGYMAQSIVVSFMGKAQNIIDK